MHWSSAVSDAPSITEAAEQACARAADGLQGRPANLVFVFVSAHHADSYHSVPELLQKHFGDTPVVGCSAVGVIGGGHEVEHRPGLAVTAAHLPGVAVTPFDVRQEDLPTPDAPPEEWQRLIGVQPGAHTAIVLLPDPFTLQADALLAGLDYAFPGSVKSGGLASGGDRPGANALFIDDRVRRSGAVGAALTGNVAVETIVAQGCRPIGRPMVITECRKNVIDRLGDETPLDVLRDLFEAADAGDQELIRRSLQLGVVMDPLSDTFAAGDFLIRNVIGAEEDGGSLAVGEKVREGQVVQFHVQDAEAAAEDIRAALERYREETTSGPPASAMLFNCLRRGRQLFGMPDHDTGLFRSLVAEVPVTGFFGNGQIGPGNDGQTDGLDAEGATFLHGFTSSFAIFRPRHAEARK